MKLCQNIPSKKLLNDFMLLFLTHEEKESLTTRFLIVQELIREEMTQREMSERLRVSIAKITRGSNAMKTIDPNLKRFLEKFLK